jgi:hypothetical protein
VKTLDEKKVESSVSSMPWTLAKWLFCQRPLDKNERELNEMFTKKESKVQQLLDLPFSKIPALLARQNEPPGLSIKRL